MKFFFCKDPSCISISMVSGTLDRHKNIFLILFYISNLFEVTRSGVSSYKLYTSHYGNSKSKFLFPIHTIEALHLLTHLKMYDVPYFFVGHSLWEIIE